MTQVSSNLQDLNHIVERTFSARFVAEPLVSFDSLTDARIVRSKLEAWGFDLVGVRTDGRISGYAQRTALGSAPLETYHQFFDPRSLVDEYAPLRLVLDGLRVAPQVFVVSLGQVIGIVTKGDLQKMPVRMWLFALVSMLEMHISRLVREVHSDNSWVSLLPPRTVKNAERLYQKRKESNEETDLVDCLAFSSKLEIVCSTPGLTEELGLDSDAQERLMDLNEFRNLLAHSKSVIEKDQAGDWRGFFKRADLLECLLKRCEQA